MDLKFRNLTKEEIEVRVGGGKSLLLYKTARVDAQILDETVGAFNWQKRFYQVKNTMICEIGINVNYEHPEMQPMFVFKGDGGDDDFTMEKVKGECSDSFKRAGFAWGIGRNLYSAPKIKIPDQFANAQFFDLEEIEYDKNNRISKLVITTNFGKDVVYSYPRGANVSQTSQNTQEKALSNDKGTIRPNHKALIDAKLLTFNQEQSDKFFEWLDKKCGTMTVGLLSEKQGEFVCKSWKLI